ncbi:MAG: FIST C-terminal domain-containing protein [Polyangiaceae bacterium]|jgi:methyl-accepting chemotaxis protein|nr:FIST C-terminal domain-containing protein [Polyangiaceae bacterium]
MTIHAASVLMVNGVGQGISDLRAKLGGRAPALLLAFASPREPLAGVLSSLQGAFPGAVVVGSTTAGEFSEEGERKGAVSVLALAGEIEAQAGLGRGLRGDMEGAVAQALASLSGSSRLPHQTALLLFDALAGRGEELSLLTSALLGEGVRIVGGAAGDDLQMRETSVGVGGEVATDAAVVVLLSTAKPLGLGVHHGHVPLSPPLRVTRAEGARLHEVEGRPAWEVWLEHTRAAAAAQGIEVERLSPGEEGGFLLRFEAGLAAGSSFKIRAPLRRFEDGSLLFASEVPEGSFVRITQSSPSQQIASAREAARKARADLGGPAPAGAVVFDCICRNLILGEQFQEAVTAMQQELGGCPLAGFETYGEIAMGQGEMSGFHNTTSVVLAFPG